MMNVFRFVIKSLWYYRRRHLAVFAGMLISTAVLTGALIVGDSVKYSLKHIVDLRLGNARYALQSRDRYVRADLAGEMGQALKTRAAALLVVRGAARNPEDAAAVSSTSVVGIDSSFCHLMQIEMPTLTQSQAVISENLAGRLHLKAGDDILLRIGESGLIPVNAPFAAKNDAPVALRLKIAAIASAEQMGHFSLKNSQTAPFNVFVNRKTLARRLQLVGRANVILLGRNDFSPQEIENTFAARWKFADAGLDIQQTGDGKYDLVSKRIFIDPPVAQAAGQIEPAPAGILTYLVNDLAAGKRHTPYSFVTAAALPILPVSLSGKEMIVNSWLADDLHVRAGDSITMTYFVIGPLRKLSEEKQTFVLKKIIPLQHTPDMRTLMPDFPGLAEAGSCTDWNSSVPISFDRIRDKDEKYWDHYRGTPKAFIAFEAGRRMWGNQFGDYTAFRFDSLSLPPAQMRARLLNKLKPEDLGLTFRPAYTEGMQAATQGVDFGGLFLSLSFFVIVAALLLTALLFSLNAGSRLEEAAVLAALGFGRGRILNIQLFESLFVALPAAVAGAIGGLLYNRLILMALNSVWQDVVRTQMLQMHVRLVSLITGAAAGLIIAGVMIYFVLRRKLQQPLAGLIRDAWPQKEFRRKSRFSLPGWAAVISLTGSLIILGQSLYSGVFQSGMFLTAGGLFLTGAVALVYRQLIAISAKKHHLPLTRRQLALKNISRNKYRSTATIAMLALGTFTVIITGANRNTFYGSQNNRSSGTGGYDFWMETSSPVVVDLNSKSSRQAYGLEKLQAKFVQFDVLEGDDASCLNLNQISRPRLLGVDPDVFSERGSFSFAKTLPGTDRKNAWQALAHPLPKGAIPAVADQTVITWGLMKKIGDTLIRLNERGDEIPLVLVGGLANSVFQGNILIPDSAFRANFPSAGGSSVMLVDATGPSDEVEQTILTRLSDYGVQLMPTTLRLAEFNSVTNTYLAVFMILGWLGMLMGTAGMGIVLIRNLLERRREMALMKAIGFTENFLQKVMFTENLLILIAGMVIGMAAAFIGILPSLISPSYDMDIWFVGGLLLLIFINGLIWIRLSSVRSTKRNIIDALRSE